jgi:hypothetical protein
MNRHSNHHGLVAQMRLQIADYRAQRVPMESMVAALRWAFSIGSERLRGLQDSVEEPLVFLEAVVASGSDHSTAVETALDEIDSALRSAQKQHAA